MSDAPQRPTSANPALRRLDALIGEWSMLASSDGKPLVAGRTTFAWSTEGDFVVQRADTEPADFEVPAGWVANSPFPTTAIIGVDDSSEQFAMLYSDARDVFRVYQLSLTDGLLTISRAAPGFHQRYIGRFSADHKMITGGWEGSPDGTQWTPDFQLDYTRLS